MLWLPWWLSGKESACQCRRQGFDPWVRKIPWRRKWQPSSVLLLGKSHGQRSLAGYSPRGHKRVGHDWATKTNNRHKATFVRLCAHNHVWRFATPWTVAHQAALSMKFSKQEHRSGLPFPSAADLLHPGIEPVSLGSPELSGRFTTSWAISEATKNVSVQLAQWLSHVRLFATPWTAAHTLLFFTNSWCLLKPMSIESVMPSNRLILCHPLLLPPSIIPSIRVFSNESALNIRWPKYWSFSFSISPSNEYSGLVSFRMVWLDLLAVQGTLKSLFQHHSSKASILQHSAFFIVQLSHPYMTTEKTMVLTRWTLIGKVMSLLFKRCLGWS